MSLRRSDTLATVVSHARDIAGEVDDGLQSSHLLLALFTTSNPAASLLNDHRVEVDDLLGPADEHRDEPSGMVDRLLSRARRIASGADAPDIRCIHLLAALLRLRESCAWRALKEAGVAPAALRPAVMSKAVGPGPTSRPAQSSDRTPRDDRETASAEAIGESLSREEAPSSIGVHPALDVGTSRTCGNRPGSSASEASPEHDDREHSTKTQPTGLDDTPTFQRRRSGSGTTRDTSVQTNPRDERAERQSPGENPPEPDTAGDHQRDAERDLTGPDSAPSLADRLFSGEDAISKPPPADEPLDWEQNDEGDPLESTNESADAGPGEETDSRAGDGSSDAASPGCYDDAKRQTPDVTPTTNLGMEYALDPDVYPTLSEFGRNLTLEAAEGETDPVIGRDDEIIQLIDILGKRRTNNPLLVGAPGVGKTAIVEGLANRFVKLGRRDRPVGGRTIIELELGRLLSGTQLRGAFSERLLNIKDEMVAADGDVIVFLDEIHAWMDAGGSDGADATSELKTALARGQLPCIGATTNDEYREFIEVDPAFDRRFEVCRVDEPSADETVDILDGLRDQYESHHAVEYDQEALSAAVDYSQRYIHDRRLPDKALGLIDLAGSRTRRLGDETVTRRRIAEVVSRLRDVPVDRLLKSARQRFLNCADRLREDIVGQDHVVESVSDVLQRNYAGFRGERPIGSLLFLGPTGVGKTEMVKTLADFLFDDRDAIVDIDMSEYMESHAVSRFVGAPPGYVGFDEGGQLTEEIRHRPYQVVLLDEIEKAHRDVLNILLQVFEEGRLTDGRGRPVDFSNTLIVMTSNLGADRFSRDQSAPSNEIGFGTSRPSTTSDESARLSDQTRQNVLRDAREHFTPELWNRLDERLVFNSLSRSDVARIAEMQLEESASHLQRESDVDFTCGPRVVEYLIDAGGYDPELGARPMRETIRREVEGMIARSILQGEIRSGETVRLTVSGDELTWTKNDADARKDDRYEAAPTVT